MFFTTYSTKICFSTVTHLAYHEKEYTWEALLVTYNMNLCQGFQITVISGDQELSALNHLTTVLPTTPCLDWMAASQHCGLIECYLKEKLCLLCHSLLFTMVPDIMVVRMVLHSIKFVKGLPCWGGVKHFSPDEIMTGHHLHKSNIALSFGVYCQVVENVQPWNNLTPWTQAAILVGNSGKLFGGQVFLALDTGHTIIRHQWVALPMLPAEIDRANLLGQRKPAMLTFINRHIRDISDDNPQDANSVGILDDDSIIIHPAMEIPGVDMTTDPAETAGVDPDFDVESMGLDMDTNVWAMDTNVLFDDNAVTIDGIEQQDPTEGAAALPTAKPTNSPKKAKSPAKKTAPPKTGMAAQNSHAMKAPEKYVPSMKGNKNAIALTQITLSLQGSKDALCMAQRSVKLMWKGLHRCTDIVGMVMAQVSMKAALKKWGKATEQAITIKMMQLHWHNLFKPMHWHELTQAQKEHILESHIFVEEK